MNRIMKSRLPPTSGVVALSPAVAISPAVAVPTNMPRLTLAQAMVPPTGMMDAQRPIPMNERMLRRFPQPVSVGDLIGLPVLDQDASMLGYVRQVVRTPQGWFGRRVAVPIEVVGIEGQQLVSLDMPPREYAAAPTWQGKDATILSADATIRIALARS
jgi:hypothetical protein